MRRIRADFDGGIWAHRRDEFGHVFGETLWLEAGSEVPGDVWVSDEHLEPASSDQELGATNLDGGSSPAGGGGDGPGKDVSPPPPDFFDPDERTVDEVNTLLEDAPIELVRAVVEAESAGRGRHGIIAGPAAKRLPHGE